MKKNSTSFFYQRTFLERERIEQNLFRKMKRNESERSVKKLVMKLVERLL